MDFGALNKAGYHYLLPFPFEDDLPDFVETDLPVEIFPDERDPFLTEDDEFLTVAPTDLPDPELFPE